MPFVLWIIPDQRDRGGGTEQTIMFRLLKGLDLNSAFTAAYNELSAAVSVWFRGACLYERDTIGILENYEPEVLGMNNLYVGRSIQRNDLKGFSLQLQYQVDQMTAEKERHAALELS